MIVVGVGGAVVDSAVFDSAVVDVGGAWHTVVGVSVVVHLLLIVEGKIREDVKSSCRRAKFVVGDWWYM